MYISSQDFLIESSLLYQTASPTSPPGCLKGISKLTCDPSDKLLISTNSWSSTPKLSKRLPAALAKNLRVIFDSMLSFIPHIKSINKYGQFYQNPSTPHHLHCFHAGPSHHLLLTVTTPDSLWSKLTRQLEWASYKVNHIMPLPTHTSYWLLFSHSMIYKALQTCVPVSLPLWLWPHPLCPHLIFWPSRWPSRWSPCSYWISGKTLASGHWHLLFCLPGTLVLRFLQGWLPRSTCKCHLLNQMFCF